MTRTPRRKVLERSNTDGEGGMPNGYGAPGGGQLPKFALCATTELGSEPVEVMNRTVVFLPSVWSTYGRSDGSFGNVN
jgi:hypothetical protein